MPEVTVEPNLGWDAAFVARQTRIEIEWCRQVIERRLGLTNRGSGDELRVHHVHDSAALQRMIAAMPRSERVLRWGVTAFLQPSANRLVFARDAEVRERTYMMSLALVLARSGVGPIWFADSVAIWLSGLALNRIQHEECWERGRVWEALHIVPARILWPGQFLGVCRWGAKPLPFNVDLAYEASGLDPLFQEFSDIDMTGGLDAVQPARVLSWLFVHFLATFDVGPDGRMKFGGVPKYESVLKELVTVTEPAQREAMLNEMLSHHELLGELAAYQRFLLRKVSLGQARKGVIIPWDEYTNTQGKKTGQADDDLLR